jgi:hypothetical protein
VSSYNRDPLTEHSVIHHHDLRDGGMNEPAGGETAEEHKRDTPKKHSRRPCVRRMCWAARRMRRRPRRGLI